MSFVLHAPYKLSGDQPQAVEKLSQTLQDHTKKSVLVGVTGSGKTMTMASVIEKIQRPTLIITHNKTLAAQLYREFKDFFPNNAVEYFISYYDYYQPEAYVPTSDSYIEKESSINAEIEMLRLRCTASLMERRDVIIVSSVSCIYGLGSPESYKESVLVLAENKKDNRDDILKKLLKMQYNRNDISRERGTFKVNGDIIEIMPAYNSDGIRVSFFGDTIEDIFTFDVVTGKKKSKLDLLPIYPAKHFITSDPLLETAIKNIKEELEEQIKFFKNQNKPLEEERIRQRTMYDIEMLKEMGHCNGIENYSRHLTGREPGSRPICLFDYFQEDSLIIIDESHVTLPQIGGMYEGDQSRKRTLVNFGFRLPSALDNRPLNFKEFETLAKNIMYVSATPSEYEMQNANSIVEQIIRPTGLVDPEIEIRSTKNQMDDLVHEIEKRVQVKERVLITTLTKKMSEDICDYYSDLGIKVRYLHSEIDSLERLEILQDLRKGIFDVLIGINLLREGLDLPEVSLVAILDADKEGFLRSTKSLIQTMGRAARNINGKVIMYADKITKSMNEAISETNRRRTIQEEYNKVNNITPQTIKKDIVDIINRTSKIILEEVEQTENILSQYNRKNFKSKKDWEKKVTEAMLEAAKNLDFEKAAMLRDLML